MSENKEHFEDVWDYAERTFKLNPIEKDKIINNLITELNNLRKLYACSDSSAYFTMGNFCFFRGCIFVV